MLLDTTGAYTKRSGAPVEDGLRISKRSKQRDVGLIDCSRLYLIATDTVYFFVRGFVYSADPFVCELLDFFLEPFEVISG
jgi:hypothetical protein